MQIHWWTLALQAVNFLVLVWLLWRFLYRPVKEVIEKRRGLAEQAFAEAENREADAEAARKGFEEQRAGLVQERDEMIARLHEEIDAERRDILERARREAASVEEAATKAVAEEREAAFREARDHVAALAEELAATLLGKVGATTANGPFLERLLDRFGELPEEERERLRRDAADGGRLTVVTASPLADDEQARWRQRLGTALGLGNGIAFDTDPEILGGAELRFPHAALKFSWAEQLRQARDLLESDDAAS